MASRQAMPERILIVDDEETICEIISSMLVHSGYECQTTGSGDEALEWLRSGVPFDLIVSDILRKGLDGPGLLERVVAEFPGLPLIFATCVDDHSVHLMCLRRGACGYLNKPFVSSDLLLVVSRALAIHHSKSHPGSAKSQLAVWATVRTEQLRQILSEPDPMDEASLARAWRHLDTNEKHRQQVAAFAIGIGRAMNLPKERISALARAAFIHDIVHIPAFRDIFLNSQRLPHKIAPLLPHEIGALCRGYDDADAILKATPALRDIAEIVYAYQEYFDGTGYPCGVKGDQIPLEARIISVVHKMITAEVGGRNSGQRVASVKQEIQRRSGHQYDPKIVDAVLQLSADDWEDMDAETRLMRWH